MLAVVMLSRYDTSEPEVSSKTAPCNPGTSVGLPDPQIPPGLAAPYLAVYAKPATVRLQQRSGLHAVQMSSKLPTQCPAENRTLLYKHAPDLVESNKTPNMLRERLARFQARSPFHTRS